MTYTGSTRIALLSAGIAIISATHLAGQDASPLPGSSGIDTTSFSSTIRPQDDFYRFANERWMQRNSIPADRSMYSSFDELHDASQAALRQLVEDAAREASSGIGGERQK